MIMNPKNPFTGVTHEVFMNEEKRIWKERRTGGPWTGWKSFDRANPDFLDHMLRFQIWRPGIHRYKRIK